MQHFVIIFQGEERGLFMSKFAERMKIYMETTGTTQTDIIEKCKPYFEKFDTSLNKSTLSLYLSGKRNPKLDKIRLIGLALNVSTEWLYGGSDDPIPTTNNKSGIDNLYSMLNDNGKQKAIDYIADLLENPKYRKVEE